MHHEFPVDRAQSVFVEIESGSVEVTSTDDHRLELELTGPGADATVVEHTADGLTVVGPRSHGFSRSRAVHVKITAPTGSDLVTKLGSADVLGVGTFGSTRITTGSGSVTVGEVTGQAVVRTGSGDVRLFRIAAGADLKSGSGDIAVDHLDGASRLATGSGRITVEHANAAVSLKSGSGDLRIGEAATRASLTTASGDLEVRRLASGRADLKNVSGDIRLGVPAGTPVWTDISTGTGQVRSRLTPTGAPADGQPHVEVTAKTVTGDVYLDQL